MQRFKMMAALVLFLAPAAAGGDRADTQASLTRVPAGAAGTSLTFVKANGIRMRVAEQGNGPLVLMLHGFPESWYSWRHQLRALAAIGYRAVAPDMRGYGGTDAPAETEAYDAIDLCADVTSLIGALGEKQAVLVGHDWGAAVAWYCALLEPEYFTAVVGMSVPWGPRSDSPPLARLRQAYGENFFYMLYFQDPGVAEAELDADPRGLLRRFLASPGAAREPATITDPKADAGGLIGRIGMPMKLPIWLAGEDLSFYVTEFERTGFGGGLRYYRNLDRSWELTSHLEGARIEVPALFIAGEKDLVLRGRDRAAIEGPLRQVAPGLRDVHLLPNAGHWIQQERADEVNALLIDFLRALPGSAAPAAGPVASGEIASARQKDDRHRRDAGRINPGAPPETAQFSFLVGEWDCVTKFMKPDGSGYGEGRASWIGYFILDGWAIQDDWIRFRPDGQEFHGTNIRSFNPQTKKWDNRWLPAGSLQWKYFEAEQKGDTMVMIGGEGKDRRGDFIDRNTFYEISAGHWRWRKDRSYDGGETWVEGIGFIEATRASVLPDVYN